MADVLDLLAARAPLPPVRFPNGRVLAVRESDGFLEQLLEEAALEKSGEKFEQAWKYLIPDATPKDLGCLVTQDYANILAHARQNVIKALAFVEDARKNGPGGIAASAPATPPSSPTAASSPPSPASPAPSVATGSSSAPVPTGAPSSRPTRSRRLRGSTPSSPTSTP